MPECLLAEEVKTKPVILFQAILHTGVQNHVARFHA